MHSVRIRRALALLVSYLLLLQTATAAVPVPRFAPAVAAAGGFDVTADATASWVSVATLASSSPANDMLEAPSSLAVAPNGDIYVADTGHHQVRVVRANGSVDVIAGTGKPGDSYGPALQSQLASPAGIAFHPATNSIYIADSGNHKVKKLTSDGALITVAGSGRPGFRDGSGSAADFHQPAGIALATDGALYVADTLNHAIRRIGPAGDVTTIAGAGRPGHADGAAPQALLHKPSGIAVDASGALYVADTLNHVIRRIANGSVSTVAGTTQPGHADGAAAGARFDEPSGIAVDGDTLLVADAKNHRIRRIDLATAAVTTVAGSSRSGLADGAPSAAQFKMPGGIAFAGAAFVADGGNDAIRVIYPSLTLSSVQPSSGPASGGNQVRIFGSGFVPGATRVRFGSAEATSVTFVSGGEVVAVAPSGAGRVDVTVTTPAGTASLTGAYSFGSVLEVLSVTPRKSSTAGGITVTVTGSNFVAGGTRLFIGSNEASNVVVASPTVLTARVPSGFPGLASVRVVTAEGQATKNAAFTYFGVPHISGFTPAEGFVGTNVTINGFGFDPDPGATQVRFGTIAAVPASVTATTIVVSVPQGAVTSRISVTTIGGTANSANSFVKKSPLVSVQVLPAQTLLGIGEKQQFIAIGTDTDGLTADVTASVTWTSSNPPVATVAGGGRITVAGAGSSTIRAAIQNLSASGVVSAATVEPPPADPATVATPIDESVRTSVGDSMRFLFEGPTPIQRGVTPNAISEERIAVIRGQVLTVAGQPLEGVRVSSLRDSDYGYTRTRADGRFDFAANGGNYMTLVFEKSGYPSVQRVFRVEWEEVDEADPVIMTAFDSAATPVSFSAATTTQVARANPVSDADGQRRATLLFAPATTATMVLPNGTTAAVTSATVRATEYTVGPNGPAAMPGELPSASGYTYAAELSLDEAVAAGATEVRFSKPVYVYLENFLNLRSGVAVPAGYYDRVRGAWIPSDNGRVIKVMAINAGMADIDANGDNIADDATALAALGFTDDERRELATLYAAGQTLWRVPVKHFTPWDFNFPYGPPSGAAAPAAPDPEPDSSMDEPQCTGGSVIECENQTLGESVPVAGTGMRLHYSSDRVEGRKHGALKIHLTGATLPPNLKRVDLEIDILGRKIERSFAPSRNLTYDFAWDGDDAYGRKVSGYQSVNVNVGFTYDAVYQEPAQLTQSFGAISGIPMTGSRARTEITLWKRWTGNIGHMEAREYGIGGWTLTEHHTYDRGAGLLLMGDGTRRSAEDIGRVISTLTGQAGFGYSGDGGPAAEAMTKWFMAMEVGPDGSIYIAENGNDSVRKIDRNGIITRIAGGGGGGADHRGGGFPALETYVHPDALAVGPDGLLYLGTNNRILRINRQGIMEHIAGNGVQDRNSGDGGSALLAAIAYPRDFLFAPDGTLYFTTYGSIRYVRPDGIIDTFLGKGLDDFRLRNFSGDGGPASKAGIDTPTGMVWGPDGAFYFSDMDNHRVRRVGQDGIITTVAGSGCTSQTFCSPEPPNRGDGGKATSATLRYPQGLAFDRSGALYIAERNTVRRVTPDGTITTFAGRQSSQGIPSGDGGPASAADMGGLLDVRIGSGANDALYISDSWRLRRVGSPMPGFAREEVTIASSDGAELYVFDEHGRHVRTINPNTNAIIYRFTYSGSRLSQITDEANNVITINYSAGGATIVAPGGKTTTLGFNPDGYLASVTNPAGESVSFGYGTGGLLTSMTDARSGTHHYGYDALGKLTSDLNPAGGSKTLVRTGSDDVFNVRVTTALGRAITYFFQRLPNGGESRTTVDEAGLSTTVLTAADQSQTVTSPDGTRVSIVLKPDPRFGLSTPIANTTITTPGGRTLTLAETREVTLSDRYNPLSMTLSKTTTSINGRATVTTFDPAARTITRVSPANRTSTTSVDALGRAVREDFAGFAPVQYSYDGRGFLASMARGSRTTTFNWDAKHELASVTDSLSRTTEFVRDPAGRVVRTILPDRRQIAYGYDANGNVTSITPPGRPAHGFSFSAIDQRTSYTPAGADASGATTYTYDKDGILTSIARPGGDVVTIGQDGAGRTSSITARSVALQYGYDGAGRIASITGAPANITYAYDGSLQTGETWSGAVTASVSTSYDNDFRVSGEAVNGQSVAFGYDPDGLLVSAGSLLLARDPASGTLTGTQLGTFADEYTYNEFGEATGYIARHNGTPLLAFIWTRDSGGRVASKSETVSGSTASETYSYDAYGRLTGVTRDGTIAATYDYDANSNRTAATVGGNSITATYDDQDRLLTYGDATFTYNSAGELRQKTTPAGTTTYTYDGLGALRSVVTPSATIEYLVDASNRRVGRKVNGVLQQAWVYDSASRVVAELDGSGAVVSRFVYGTRVNSPDLMIRNGVTYRIVHDHLGSPRMVVDTATGAIAQYLQYDEFGRLTGDTSPGFQPFAYAGGLYDPATGLVRFGERDYDAQTGRWTAKDPILFSGGDTNLYGYTWNDPINWIDPSGLNAFCTLPGRIPPFTRLPSQVARAAQARPTPRATPPPRLRPATQNKPGQPPNPGSGPSEGTPVRNPRGMQKLAKGAETATRGIDKWKKFLDGFEDLADILSSTFPFLVSPDEVRQQIEQEQQASSDFCGCSI